MLASAAIDLTLGPGLRSGAQRRRISPVSIRPSSPSPVRVLQPGQGRPMVLDGVSQLSSSVVVLGVATIALSDGNIREERLNIMEILFQMLM